LSFALLLVAVGMIRARSAHADGDEIAAFTLVGLTGAIVGPVSDSHKLVWVVPAVADPHRRGSPANGSPNAGRYPDATTGSGAPAGRRPRSPPTCCSRSATSPGTRTPWRSVLLVNALPWRPGVAPAFPINRWAKRRRRRPPAIRARPGP
jgi:alpha-1,2-mannosyltransferase